MELLFVHGWSVRNTDTYGELPTRLEMELARRGQTTRVEHIYLGKYVSFNDEVTLDDLALAFDCAVREKGLTRFACITHSTGGPLVRNWLLKHSEQNDAKLSHLVMLAPANHGSALAQLGKSRLGRIKAFFDSVEPGQRILDWLELGSEEQWALNLAWLRFDAIERGTFPFVITGNGIDRKLYDHLNSYTGEPGSDGVVRVAAANLNYGFIRLRQQKDGLLEPTALPISPRCALAILPDISHGGNKMGIMSSVGLDHQHPTVSAILACLAVQNEASYEEQAKRFQQQNEVNEAAAYSMAVFRVVDEQGQLMEDYDLLFTTGEDASPDGLPQGFFQDRQRNRRHAGRLTYYLNHDRLKHTKIGFEVRARPDSGLVLFAKGSLAPQLLGAMLRANQTLMVEIVLRRLVDRNCFQFTQNRRSEAIEGQASGEVC